MVVKVLVIGGTGVFGSKLVRLLAAAGFNVAIGVRNTAVARALMESLPPDSFARCEAVSLDLKALNAPSLRSIQADVVVNTAGPFEAGDYSLPLAVVASGAHYLDISDSRGFCKDFVENVNNVARQSNVVAWTGVSSTPCLSNAAIDALRSLGDIDTFDRVHVGISPGNRAPRGIAVLRSILSYAGQPTRVFTRGSWLHMPGWGNLHLRYLPGIGFRWQSLCVTPDLDVLPARFHPSESALFLAGVELWIMHLGLWALTLPVRAGIVRSIEPLASPLHTVANWLYPFGTDRGGMYVEVSGRTPSGGVVCGEFALVAQAGDGPYIPILPVVAAVRQLARGGMQPGAAVAAGVLPLGAITAEFSGLSITSALKVAAPTDVLIARVLGQHSFAMLAPPVRLVRGGLGSFKGRCAVAGSSSLLARLLRRAAGLPQLGMDVPIEVTIAAGIDGVETWRRCFGGRAVFHTRMSQGFTPSCVGGLVLEHIPVFGVFGVLSMGFEVTATAAGGTLMQAVTARVCGLRVPMLARVFGTDCVDSAGRYTFHVKASLPLVGILVDYHGWLEPA